MGTREDSNGPIAHALSRIADAMGIGSILACIWLILSLVGCLGGCTFDHLIEFELNNPSIHLFENGLTGEEDPKNPTVWVGPPLENLDEESSGEFVEQDVREEDPPGSSIEWLIGIPPDSGG